MSPFKEKNCLADRTKDAWAGKKIESRIRQTCLVDDDVRTNSEQDLQNNRSSLHISPCSKKPE